MTNEYDLNPKRKECTLIEYCGDFHVIGIKACEGEKNNQNCSSLIQINNEIIQTLF